MQEYCLKPGPEVDRTGIEVPARICRPHRPREERRRGRPWRL